VDFYERAGCVRLGDGCIGSPTIGGTIGPAGGNFDEPVTRATLKAVGAFHALSRERADARCYPAVDPLEGDLCRACLSHGSGHRKIYRRLFCVAMTA
jgi:vacuolar-type H+-ATPase catalytic subunit A/Vma1